MNFCLEEGQSKTIILLCNSKKKKKTHSTIYIYIIVMDIAYLAKN